MIIDESAEWTTGGEDSSGPDPARCGMPSDTELFSEQWGAGLVINSRGASYEVKRMAKISFHSSMNHKDRSLFHAYKVSWPQVFFSFIISGLADTRPLGLAGYRLGSFNYTEPPKYCDP